VTYKRANGTGSVYKLSGRRRKPWVAVVSSGWTLDGDTVKQKRYVIGTFATRNDALIALADYNRLPFQTDNANMTFEDLYQSWYNKVSPEMNAGTLKNYRGAHTHLSPLKDLQYKTITISQVEKLLDQYNFDAQNRMISLIRRLDKEAAKLDIPIKHIGQSLSRPKSPIRKEKHIFTEDEIDTIWEHADDHWCQIILVYIYMGWRNRELISMKKADVDIENWTMKGGNKTAAGKNRIVPIHSRIRPIVKGLYDNAPDGGTIIHVRGREPSWKYVYENFQRTMARFGMVHIVHETRHTFRTRLINAGGNRSVIDKLCGHSPKGSIGDVVYTHISIDQMRETIELLR